MKKPILFITILISFIFLTAFFGSNFWKTDSSGALTPIGDRGVVIGTTDLRDFAVQRMPLSIDITNIEMYGGSSDNILSISTPYGPGTATNDTDQLVHPSLIFEPIGWNGYKYWLAYTAFASGDSDYENPCIAVSNDFSTWTTPTGLTNPIVGKPAGATDYNADTHIVLSPDRNKMYMLYRERLNETNTNNLKISYSSDGVNWSASSTIKTGSISGDQDYASPSMWWTGAQWKLITHNLDGAGTPVQIFSCIAGGDPTDSSNWGDATTVTVNGGITPYHSEFRILPSGHLFGMIYETGGDNALYWAYSTDGGLIFNTYIANDFPNPYKAGFAFTDTSDSSFLKLVLSHANNDWYFYESLAVLGKSDKEKGRNASRSSILYNAQNSFGGTIASSLFTGSDSTTDLPNTLENVVWSQTAEEIGISTNRAYATSSGNCVAYLDIGVSDFEAYVDFTTLGTQQFFLFRRSDSTHFYRLGQNSAGQLRIQQYNTTLVLDDKISGLTAGDKIGVECRGNYCVITQNYRAVYRLTDTDYNENTQIGLQGSGATQGVWDNLAVGK